MSATEVIINGVGHKTTYVETKSSKDPVFEGSLPRPLLFKSSWESQDKVFEESRPSQD